MNADEYRMTLDLIGAQARMIEMLDLEGMQDAMERAEATGWIVDPTLYRRFLYDPDAQLDWETTRALVRSFAEVQRLVRQMRATWAERHPDHPHTVVP